MADEVYVGDRFYVESTTVVRDKSGRVITKFLPGFGYAVTKRNIEVVREAMEAKTAVLDRGLAPQKKAEMRASSDAARILGKVTTKEK